MSPEDRDAAHVWDTLDTATAALSYVAELAVEAATADEMRMEAFERKLEVLGEAARRVSSDFVAAHPKLPWRGMIALRNVLAHKYGDIDRVRLYETATRELPPLIEQLKLLLPPTEAG
jgi:uncharacterized protein with HEPN domain